MTDSMSPISLDEMLGILQNPNFKTYLVIGKKSDKAWNLALATQNYLPGVRSYLVKPDSQAQVRDHFNVPSDHVGIVFGRSDSVSKTLTKDQTEDFLKVAESINNA